MLQPRLTGFSEKGRLPVFVCAALLLSSITCQELNYDDSEQIESTRIKREGVPENRDLTVLLVDQKRNDYNTKLGRYRSVKPLIGLLTSTARTFIQDGVTTEFATQILGTTLDNGRIYAQLLTKSSLVLYNKPTNVEDPVIVKPTRVHSVFDGQWNVKQDLGFIDPEKFVLKNTDYLAPSSKMEIVYASKPQQENVKFWNPSAPESQADNQIFDEPVARRVQPVKEIPRYVQNEAFNYLDGPSIETDKKFEFIVEPSVTENVNTYYRQSKAYDPVIEPIKVDSRVKEEEVVDQANVVKVKPNFDLPTFTIKNEFSPIFYYIDNVESRRPQPQVTQQTKLPKKLFGQKSEPRQKKTFTYAGFADFTTVVGDTVIVFTPNTETVQSPNPDEVNVYPSAKRVDKLATKITFLAADIPVATTTYKAYETPSPSKAITPGSYEENRSEKALYNDEDSLKKVLYEVDDRLPDSVRVQYNNDFGLNVDVIQPSEAPFPTTESTRITDDLQVIPIQGYQPEATEPLAPSSTILDTSTESVVTEGNIAEVFTNSEEESDNTAAEVTEKMEEEDEDEEETTTEMEPDIMTTTESGHSGESSEEMETTTETRYVPMDDTLEDMHEVTHEVTHSENHEETHEQVVCTDGLETLSTMTTAYKTLTYLTTYFIPLESTETTTSIKSDVVVESNVGYLTNVVCKTQFDIEPTSVINVDVNYSVQTKIHSLESVSEESITKPPIESEIVTESPQTTMQQEDTLTTIQDDGITFIEENVEEAQNDNTEEKETITTEMTTEHATTSQSRVEVSVSTEHSTDATEEPLPQEEYLQENEIDVIYKTLYTTYTYLTTFFGDQTSSVASHKSVVTNIITSTIDLSKLDPSLLGAFNEDEIAPTGVGVGRPTESFAINSIIDLVKNKDVIESVEVDENYSSQTPTPSLGDDVVASIKPDAVKTYYTTYTFFTTIYVGTDANVCSRSEIYTNYVGPDELIPTKTNPLTTESTKAQFDFRNCKQVKMEQLPNQEENSSMETSVSMEHNNYQTSQESRKEILPQPTPIEVDMLFSVESNPLESENSYVTDVKSSSSKGERKFLDSNNIILDDQISSESNIEEILPSPTLLLQTSYTTFTYFTTMYIGKDSSKVKSRLETITNVVTETIMPNKEPEEENNLPITYYTTFTYWTTLYKDKSTTITSREEIVSNVVTPIPQSLATISPIDTTPIEVENVIPPKELEIELKPSAVNDNLESDDGKATFYTTYTYFTTFYTGNTSQISSSLETVTNIVDNTKLVEDNQLGRKVQVGPADQNLIQDNGDKQFIAPTIVKEEIIPTKLPDAASASPTVLLGTYIDNLFAEVKPEDKAAGPVVDGEKKILFSQVAVISGDSTVVTSDNQPISETSSSNTTATILTSSTEGSIISPTPEVIESSVAEPNEITTEPIHESEEEEDEGLNTRKKSRLTFTPKKPSTTPVIIPFASRNRPTFIPKRVPLLSSATTITRADFTPPVITATPSLKSVRPSGFNGNRKQSAFPGSTSAGKRFPGRSSVGNISGNVPSASRPGGFAPRGSIQPTSRRAGFRSSSVRGNNDYNSRSALPRIRPTASSRFPPGRSSRQSASITFPPTDQEDFETYGTQQDENVTEPLEEITEAPARITNNPLLRFKRPPIVRQPGTAITPRSTTPSVRRGITPRGRVTTTTRRSTTRSTSNPLLSLRRQRPNALFPRRNLFKQPEPEPEEEFKEDEQKLEDSEEILEEEEFEEDNDYDSSDRKERQIPSPYPPQTKRNAVQIRPFTFKRRTKRQIDYGNRKFSNFRRPGQKTTSTRRPEPEAEAPPSTPKSRSSKPKQTSNANNKQTSRFNSRSSNTRTTTVSAPKSSVRQPFIVRGESRTTTTTSSPSYKRGKSIRPSSRTTTSASRPKAPRLSNKSTTTRGSTSRSSTRGSRTRTTTSRASSRQRSSFENLSGERFNFNNALNDGKITVTHQIPTEVTVPVVNGKITEYKNLLSATPSIETLLLNQVSTSIGPLGVEQFVLAAESTELGENGATKVIKYILHDTPTTTVIFTPTTIRGRKTSFSHILPSTVYNVEAVTQTVAPEINANVPLANLLLSQLLLGNQQPAINPLLALQGQGLLPQQQIIQTPVTELKTRTTTYVTTITDARETVLPITFRAFNTNGIVYDNSPWRPGRELDLEKTGEEDERKLKNLATRIMSNGVEVLVKDKNADGKQEQRELKLMHTSSITSNISASPTKQLLSSAVATFVSRQQISAMFPLHQLMQHNYIIKTCMTTYTYLTTVIQNKRSAISTFETIVSVVTTESLTNLYDTDTLPELKPTKTTNMDVKTIQTSASANFMNNYPKIDKRIDSEEDDNFDLIQPSEISNLPCTGSCSCSDTKTEALKTKYTNVEMSALHNNYEMKTKYGSSNINVKPTDKQSSDKTTQYTPYQYESNQNKAPNDKVVEKYTEVINDYSNEKNTNSVEESDLLTNEQGPVSTKINVKSPEKPKPDKIQKPNKNKLMVAELLKLGTLGIKGLSQLAPVFEKMTGGFIKKTDIVNETTATTIKPAVKLAPYNVNKKNDVDLEEKHNSFPIYIPVDEMETSESQLVFTNATLHQNLAWAAEHKQPKTHLMLPKIIHESSLVNGGIPISPGEIITAHSDVIVGKPAVGGPLTLAASGIKLHNYANPPPMDSFVSANEQYFVNEKPQGEQAIMPTKVDDSYDLRPPEPPKMHKPRPISKPISQFDLQNIPNDKYPYRMPSSSHDNLMKTEKIKTTGNVLINHGRPAFLDYIPALGNPTNKPSQINVNFTPMEENIADIEIADNSPSSSEVVNTRIKTNDDSSLNSNTESNKQFLVDIQPSRVANVLIPHGSSTALVFAGSTEPHKTGDYVDDPLPYPEPGYFGSFSIDAPQMTNVHNVVPSNNNKLLAKPSSSPSADSYQQSLHTYKESYKPNVPSYKEPAIRNDNKLKWKDSKYSFDYTKIPPPTSNQETHVQVGPHITVYDPEVYNPSNGEFHKYNQIRGKEKAVNTKDVIDKEYENYLAVPPPPPHPKTQFSQHENDKNKPYSQRPIVHTKPVQDMKVFLNVQHPVPKQLPPKVTSEIYFAAQMPNSKPTPTYTIHIPPAVPTYNNRFNKAPTSQSHKGATHNSFSVVSSPNISNKSVTQNEIHGKDSTYTVTLNTATNVASNSETGQVIGSSISVPVGSQANNEHLNTDIPIGTNFAVRVEDDNKRLETYNLQGNKNTQIVYDVHGQSPQISVSTGDNRWNTSTLYTKPQTTMSSPGNSYHKQKYHSHIADNSVSPSMSPSLNSHANFPMINEYNVHLSNKEDMKPVSEDKEDAKPIEAKRPPKLIPNIPTNSHGWYSSVLSENNINNIQIEATTRKIIPLIHNYDEEDSIPQFGQKVTSVGKPPTDFWSQNVPSLVNFNIGKPFTKPDTTEKPSNPVSSPTPKPFIKHYIPSNFGGSRQPAYDIPMRDNSDETTTAKTLHERFTTEKIKPVYENSEEIYDGEDISDSAGDIDGEVSSESMKIPVVSSSSEIKNSQKSSTELTLLQDEVLDLPTKDRKEYEKQKENVNQGTQTEKPFRTYNRTTFSSNIMKPIFGNTIYNNNMKPRPFTVNKDMVLDHQLQQPHWQINEMIENNTNVSYEDNMGLNIGEEIKPALVGKPFSTQKPSHTTEFSINYKNPARPTLHPKSNTTKIYNESIITSTVHIQDKKPLIVEKQPEKTTLPTFTVPNLQLNQTSSEIIDLSPPPPTLDYNFKPSTNDEMIMGMSPPPPRVPPSIRVPTRVPYTPRPALPARTPPPYRPKPPRPIPPRVTSQRPLRKPVTRDEVSTYRPAYDILNGIRKPTFNRDQPSSQLLPPPRDEPSKFVNFKSEVPTPSSNIPNVPNVVFPMPISSGWLTSSGIEFSSSFNFAPTSIQFPETHEPTKIPTSNEITSSENIYSYEVDSSSELVDDVSSEKPGSENKITTLKETSTESITSKPTETEEKDSVVETSYEETITNRVKVTPIFNKNGSRKPYPASADEKKTNLYNKYKLPLRPTAIIKPTRTLSRPEIVYPTRHTSIRKIVRPLPTPAIVATTSIIESSETSVEDDFIKPTEVLKETSIPTTEPVGISSLTEEKPFVTVLPSEDKNSVIELVPTHHAGNEVKISDEIIPTKTEFRTAVVTLTKTLSEPPKTVSSIGYVNLTHTLTVTHTKTSLVSQSEGAVTQTLILTNTHTSTIVDIVTEIHTQVQPTTIIETVTEHIPIQQVKPTAVEEVARKTKAPLDDLTMSSEESENFIIKDTTDNIIQKIDHENETDSDTFFVVMNKSQNGGHSPSVTTDLDNGEYDVTRNEQVNSNGVSQVLFGEILLAGTPFLETTNVHPNGVTYGKECQPDCKASRNERCQRIDGIMKCVCRPGFARMFPDRPCKPTYTYSVKLALGSHGKERLEFHQNLSDNSSKQYQDLSMATHEGINRMVMQSDLRDVFHGIHITGFHPVEMKAPAGDMYQGVMNDFYVQLSDNAHESRLKEVIEKYLRNNNYSLGGTEVHAASELVERLDVSDFDECTSGQFHDCSEHAQCFNLRGTYTCSCLEGFADLSVNTLYPGRICSAEPVGCERCNYHGACFSRDDHRVLCECFQWYSGSSCQINLKVVLISLVVCGALLSVVLAVCAVLACSKRRPPRPQRSIVACIQSMPSLHQGAMPKQRADRRALISERGESGDASSVQNASLPYIPAKRPSGKKLVMCDPPAHDPPPPPPAPAVMIPRARLHPQHSESRENLARKRSLELSSEAKLISYLESGATTSNDEMRRKHSLESSYSANKERHNKQGALVSAGFKVSTTVRPDENNMKDRDDLSSVNKGDLEAELSRFDSLRKSYSQEDLSEWTDAERRLGELTLSEARSVGGTLPASTGRAASSTRLTHQEANTMAERDLGSTFLLPHVHLYKPDLTSDVSEFDSL